VPPPVEVVRYAARSYVSKPVLFGKVMYFYNWLHMINP
jgi:hypothetical protein